MRRRILPFDIWLCLLLALPVALGTGKVAENLAQRAYQKEVEAHAPVAGEIGGEAGEEVFRAQNVEDLLTHDTFTVVSPGIQYRNLGAGFYRGRYFYSLTLPSGERVAAWINTASVQTTGEDIYTGDSILPVGRVVYEDLSGEETFLEQIEYGEELTRRDFYVDMVGDTAVTDEEQALEMPKMVTQVVTVLVVFPLLHMLGSKFGLFPAYFAKKKRPEWE